MPPKFTIKQWDQQDRPREKFQAKGAANLSNAELLAILIGSGSKDENAVSLMRRLLADNEHDLSVLSRIALEKIQELKGLGPVKAIKIKAALELGKRMQQQLPKDRKILTNSRLSYNSIFSELSHLEHEEFWILYLNQSNRLLQKWCLSRGGISQTTVDVRLALKRALELGATAMILVHNHPSGGLIPSQSDKTITRKFKNAAANFDIRILDHLIISEKGYFSFADDNIL